MVSEVELPIQLNRRHFYLCIGLFLLSLGLNSRTGNAQVSSSTTNTFSGDITASCSFIDFPQAIALTWNGSRLETNQNAVSGVYFSILANVPVEISHSGMTVVEEPEGVEASQGLSLTKRNNDHRLFQVYRNTSPETAELLNTANSPEPMKIFSWINFHHLATAPIGRYAHSITLSCLL